MTFHSQRHIGIGVFVFLLALLTSPVADWCRETFRLPPGYGAEGDSRFNRPMPAAVRSTVDDLSSGAEGSWVQERTEGGSWVYDLHLLTDGQSSVIHLTANGQVIRLASHDLEGEPTTSTVGE